MSAFAVKKDIQQFETALEQGRLNITESGEADAIANIEAEYKNAFLDNKQSQNVVIDNIINLTKINRLAMQQEAVKAKNISSAAAWLITFLTIFYYAALKIVIACNILSPTSPSVLLLAVLKSLPVLSHFYFAYFAFVQNQVPV